MSASRRARTLSTTLSRHWYDYIVVGAGSAGCVVANRMAAQGARVLLIEESSSLRQRSRSSCPSGGVLTSSLEAVWARGAAADYDAWAAAAGDAGWSHGALLPHFERGEQAMARCRAVSGSSSGRPSHDAYAEAFLAACGELGYAPDVGFAVAERCAGVGYCRSTPRRGQRRFALGAYLEPAMEASGPDGHMLEVISGVCVARVSFQARGTSTIPRAVGVEWDGGGAGGGTVVLCAGVPGSAALLLRSGVGPRAQLEGFGVAVVCELPGVGSNLQDHPGVAAVSTSARRLAPSPASSWGLREGLGLFARLRGLADTSSDAAVGGFIRSQAPSVGDDAWAEEASLPDDLRLRFSRGNRAAGLHGLFGRRRLELSLWLARPAACGRVELSSRHPRDPPVSVLEPLAEARDRQVLIDGLRRARDIFAAPAFKGLLGAEVEPGANLRSDADLEEYLARHCILRGNPVGTCAMGMGDAAVVDARLRVHGVEGLRVADASVMPTIVAADPYASTIAIAEKAAHMMGEDAPLTPRTQHGMVLPAT